ncbi:MAG: hypothetical protein WA309_16935 [Pseudolabrys sp.]
MCTPLPLRIAALLARYPSHRRRPAAASGQIIDRREVGDPGAFDGKTDEELMEEARKRAAALGLLPPETQH